MEVDHILHPVDGFEPVDSDHEDGDAYEDIVAERNQLRQDNDRLWQIIERQRAIIHELKLQLASVSEQTVAGTLELPTPSEDPKSVSPGVSIPSVSSFVPLQIPAAATPRISLDFSTLSVTDFTGSAQTGSSSLSHPESSLSAIEASPLGIRGSATPIEDQVANADADLEDEAEVPTSDGEDSAAGPTRAVRRREAQRRKLKEEDKRSKERDILLARKREAETSSQKFEAIGNPPASVLLSKSAAAGSQKTVSAHSRSSSLGYTEPKPGMAGGAAGQPHSSGSLTRHKRSASQDAHNPLPPDIVITTRSTSITELHAAAPANVGIVSTLPEAPLGGAEPDMPDLPSPAPPTPPIKMINSSRNNAETPLPLSHTNRNMSLSSPTLNGADANPQGVAAGSVTPTKSPQTVSHSNYVEHALPTPPQQLHRSHVPHVGVEPQRGPGGTPPPPSYPHNHPVPSLTSSSPPPPGSNAMNPPHNPNHAQQPYPGGYIGQSVSNQHLPFPPASHPHPHGFASHQPQQQQPTQPRSASPTSIQRQMSLRGVPGSPSSPTSPTLPSIPPGDLTLLSSQITSSGTTPSGGSVVPMIATTEGLQVQVLSSAILTGDAKNKEVVSFQFQVRRNLAGQGQQQAPGSTECWRIEKVYSDVVSLDAKLRSTLPKTILSKVGKPPEKSLYSTLNPAKSDQRKVALEMYLQRVVDVVTDSRDVIEFLTTNVNGVIGRSDSMTLEIEGKPTGSSSKVLKEGVLVKKGKSFGGWKTRYFKLKQTALEYYDASGREIISTIKLRHCLAMSERGNDVKSYHSFTLIEYKSGTFSVTASVDAMPPESRVVARHTLCAESDTERDEWVRIISKQIMEVRPGARMEHFNGSGEALSFSNDAISGSVNGIDGSNEQGPPPSFHARGNAGDLSGSPLSHNPSSSLSVNAPSNALQNGLHQSHHHPSHTQMPHGGGHQSFQSRSPNTQYAPGQAQAAALQFLATHAPATNRAGGLPTAPHPAAGFAGSQGIAQDSAARHGRGFVDESARIMQQSPPSLAVEDATSRAGRGVSSGTSNLTASPRIDDKRGNASKRITTAFNWAKKKATSDLAIAAGMAGGAGSGVRSPDPARVVFGVPLDQSVAVSRVNDMYELPSVVYRCIEYLDAMHAFEEEGIYRLSGLSSIIQMLKDRFNNEGDVDLLGSGERYDVHAIAGLLKLYLRELQNLTPVLTKHLQKDFIRITEIQDRTDRITELSRLVSKLPLTNYTLLRIMIAHLVRVVQASDINKMTVRNVGIVFSPTLGIPVVVLTLMMAEYDHVFCWEDPQKSQLMRDREREMADRLGKERELSLRRQAQFEADVEKAEKERQQQQQQQPPTPQQHHHHTQQRINISPMAYSDSTESRREEKQAWEASGEGPSVVIMQPHYEDAEGMDERSRNIAAKKARREQARMSIAPGLLMARNQNKAGVEDRRTNRNSFIMIDDSNTLPPRDGSASLTDETGGSDEEGHMLDMYTSRSLSRGDGSSDGEVPSNVHSDGIFRNGMHQVKADVDNEVEIYDEEVIIDGEGEVYVDQPNASYRISEYFNAYDDAGVKPTDGVFARAQQGEEEYEAELFG